MYWPELVHDVDRTRNPDFDDLRFHRFLITGNGKLANGFAKHVFCHPLINSAYHIDRNRRRSVVFWTHVHGHRPIPARYCPAGHWECNRVCLLLA